MTETLPRLLLRLSEAGEPAILWGRQAAPHAGRAFDRLLDRGVLVEQAPATEWDVCPACECGLGARPIQHINGRQIVVCPPDRRNDVVLGDDDLQSFRIHLPIFPRWSAKLPRRPVSAMSLHRSPQASGIWARHQASGLCSLL